MKHKKPVEPGKTYPVTIDGITQTGEGVASVDGFKIFVDKTVPGDHVIAQIKNVKNTYATANAVEITSPSKNRVMPVCPKSDSCGGCPYMLINYPEQLRIKEEAVYDALVRKGKLPVTILPIIGSEEYNYRNKAQFKISPSGIGFYKKRSHALVDVDSCPLQSQAINAVLPLLERVIAEYDLPVYDEKTHTGLLRGIVVRSNTDGQVMVIFVLNGKTLPNSKSILKSLKENSTIVSVYINTNTSRGNAVFGNETRCLYEREPFIEKVNGVEYILSPSAFFQVNTEQTGVLYDIVTDYAGLKDGETLFDLYCGTGTIGLYVIKKSKVEASLYGIEINPDAVENARENARLNGIENARFYQGAAETVLKTLKERPDCVILDPPRKGCDRSLLKLLLKLRPRRIVYVSCNPTTLARDLGVLERAYTIEKVQPVDMFPQTGHVETVCLLKERI